MRLLYVQNAGDVREAYHRLSNGGQETYHAQRYSIDSYATLCKSVDEFAVLTYHTAEAYDEVLGNGVRVIGGGLCNQACADAMIQMIVRYSPSHLVLHTIDRDIIRWTAKQRIPAVTTFANTFAREASRFPRNLVRETRNRWTAKSLNQANFRWVGSYGINSSRELARLGVDPAKIIPWDYLLDSNAGSFSAKQSPASRKRFTLCYVGSISAGKGIPELIHAVAILKSKSVEVTLKLVGDDAENVALHQCKQYRVQDDVERMGILPNQLIEPLMHQCDLVIVPSRHEYPEGFPLVIHHALRACTPTVASDHPMFTRHLKHRENSMIFAQKNASAMADCIEEALMTPSLYEAISAASHATWDRLRLPVKWADLVNRWVSDTPEDQQWLSERCLANDRESMA